MQQCQYEHNQQNWQTTQDWVSCLTSGKHQNRWVSHCGVWNVSYRARTSFCTCPWGTETSARRQPQGTDWPLLCPCCLRQTSPRRYRPTPCAAVKPATRGGQFRSDCRWQGIEFECIVLVFFCWLFSNSLMSQITGRSLRNRRGSRSSYRTTGPRSATWCAASTVRQEHHWQMTTTSPWRGTRRAWRSWSIGKTTDFCLLGVCPLGVSVWMHSRKACVKTIRPKIPLKGIMSTSWN